MNHWISRGTQRVSSSSIALTIFLISRSWSSPSRIWKLCGRFGVAPVQAQQPVRDAVEGAHPHGAARHA